MGIKFPHSSSTYPTPDARAGSGASRHLCPSCQGGLKRVPRRFIDLLISKFVPVHRYRCVAVMCHWEGNLRSHRHDRSRDKRDDGRNFII